MDTPENIEELDQFQAEWARSGLQDPVLRMHCLHFWRAARRPTASPALETPVSLEGVQPAADPLLMPLPCAITIGKITHAEGSRLRSLVARMSLLYALASTSGPKAFRYDEEHPTDGLNAPGADMPFHELLERLLELSPEYPDYPLLQGTSVPLESPVDAEQVLSASREARRQAIDRIFGMWKNRTDIPLDGLAYQEMVRAEWDRTDPPA
jgi:hypothetical protein